MPRPAKTPRLASVDPAALGKDLVRTYLDAIASAALSLGPAIEVRVVETPGSYSDVVHSLRDLVLYARGERLLEDTVEEYLLTLLPILQHPLGSALPERVHQAVYESIDIDALDDDPLDQLALVIAAALGRQAVTSGQSARPSWIAALANVSVKTVERAAGDTLTRDRDGWITAKSARRWLEARGALARPS